MPRPRKRREVVLDELTADELELLAHCRGECAVGCSACTFHAELKAIDRVAEKLRRLRRVDGEAFARIESAIDACFRPRSLATEVH